MSDTIAAVPSSRYDSILNATLFLNQMCAAVQDGVTALKLAFTCGHHDIVAQLLKIGAAIVSDSSCHETLAAVWLVQAGRQAHVICIQLTKACATCSK
jgi:ankyrin repeat protein